MLTHGSLFAGIGGFDLGLHWAGIETAWQVEINAWARSLLKQNYPKAEVLNDIREVGQNNLGPVNIISGGFPCQDISVAGNLAGITGPRSGLWSEMFRILRERRPEFAVIENVRNLIRLGLSQVLVDLASIGYDAEWQVISARDFGAPHIRDRIWLVAYPSRPGWEGTLCCHLEYGQDASRSEQQGLSSALDSRIFTFDEFEKRVGKPAVFGVDDGLPHRVHRLGGVGNSVIPYIPEMIGRRLVELTRDE